MSTTRSEAFRRWWRSNFSQCNLVVAAHREPYQHDHSGDEILVSQPGGGVVSLLDRVMIQTAGAWVAHGSGSADFDVVDISSGVKVPPEDPFYELYRLHLTDEQFDGYYSKFSNETLWALCHSSDIEPLIDMESWDQYTDVNDIFATQALKCGNDQSIYWIHDFQLTGVPSIIRHRSPQAQIGFFWHIPWPISKRMQELPWAAELIRGILGADLIAFHEHRFSTRFFDTINDLLPGTEVIRASDDTLRYQGRTISVKNFPAGTDFEWFRAHARASHSDSSMSKKKISNANSDRHLCLIVSRVDYSKGLLEAVTALQILFETRPQYRGFLQFVLVGAPSRTHIETYARYNEELENAVNFVNAEFGQDEWLPIQWERGSMSREQLALVYQEADSFLVPSLADGMNLVAKEFLACCRDDAALVLSSETGAAEELVEAYQFDPAQIENISLALHTMLESSLSDRRDRTTKLKSKVRHQDVYFWAHQNLAAITDAVTRRTDGQS